MTATATPRRSPREAVVAYIRDFGVLRETRAEYWGIQLVNLLDCIAYFAMLTIAAVFLSEDLGMSDEWAGYTITIFTSATSLLLLFSGMYTDWFGIRKSVDLSMWTLLVLRLAMVVVGLTPSLPYRGVLAAIIFLLMAPAMAAVQTTFQAATNRFTSKRSRGAGFNLWYLFMNIGAAAAGFSIDIVRRALDLPNVHIFTMGVITAVLCLVVRVTLIRREDQLVGPDEVVAEEPEDATVVRKRPLQIFREMIHEPALRQLLVLVALILGVRAVFVYLYLLMPKYWLRTIGPDAAIGTLSAINPIGIVIGLVLFIPLANRFNVFKMLIYGAMISSIALLPMAVPWTAWGTSIQAAHYQMAIACMILLTVGEVVWSPKLYEYTAAIAPKGQEGAYLGMSLIPWFLAKTVVSAMSGHMLNRWSPEEVVIDGQAVALQEAMINHQLSYWDRPEAMWLYLGLYALAGCVVAYFLRHWLTRGTDFRI
ncbi:MFS transporter [Thioalkalivibrio sp. XN279]|uniref:MFS transporter n=1 Tax=Thioalkalivibrio sp. XN279 TaxID=2714953 RepID=UPI001407F384|nr:MFS transporter [Thioalkalivibrio sp. XN279]NHA13965.1 MFS transporter [Thioalkalivibrio sp. XN279]